MATSSARMMVRVSSVSAPSMNMVVEDGMCTTAAPNLGKPSVSEPSMYTQFSGMNFSVHVCGPGGESVRSGGTVMVVHVMRGSLSISGSSCVDVYPPFGVSDEYGGFASVRVYSELDGLPGLCP